MFSMQKICVTENVSLYYTIPYAFCGKKDIEIQAGFGPGSSECWSDALTN